jgi:indolepyruvate ferredoxin oxidoreductase, beta subunit
MTEGIRPIKLAIAALGGQGGGVVTDWLVDVARHERALVQVTSVPGVAQRTGATIYYLEFLCGQRDALQGKEPVLALMPLPGDVDVVLAAELMEAGRMILRGLVTPERTTLIASTHRSYAVSEKMGPGDGRADSASVLTAARQHARRCIAYDMEAIAGRHRTVISAVVLGALAGSGSLPFASASYREAIRRSGVAVVANLAAFEESMLAAAAAAAGADRSAAGGTAPATTPARSTHPEVNRLLVRVRQDFPPQLASLLTAAIERLLDYQDPAYAATYLERLAVVLQRDAAARDYALTREVGRALAVWMSFEDTIRVADLKTRRERTRKIKDDLRGAPSEIVRIQEFLKPGVEEICGTLPAALGRRARRSPRIHAALARMTRDQRINTSTLRGYLLLRVIAGLARWRRGTLRFADEQQQIDAWLAEIHAAQAVNYDLAVELAKCQEIVRGYGDTRVRGLERYQRLTAAVRAAAPQPDIAARLRRWRAAALADEDGAALERELAL